MSTPPTLKAACGLLLQTECRGRSVGVSKAADLIEMPYGMWIRVCIGNYVLDGDPDPHAKGQF